jgi:hypothetical protein
MTAAATLFGVALVGTVFWLASPEAAVGLFASSRRWHPLVIGLVAGGGQAVSLTVLSLFGASSDASAAAHDRDARRPPLRGRRARLLRGQARTVRPLLVERQNSPRTPIDGSTMRKLFSRNWPGQVSVTL